MKLRGKVIASACVLALFLALYAASLSMSIDPIYGSYEAPSALHPLGTDGAGRDLMAYLFRGAGTALLFGLVAPALSILLGILVLFSIFGSRAEKIAISITDFFIGIPKYPLFILLSFALPPRNEATLLVLSLLLWPAPVRILRPTFKQLLRSGYVQSAVILGGGRIYIMLKYLLRKSSQLLISQYAWNAIRSVSMQAGLAFLGIGDITTPSWGYMIRMAFDSPRIIYTGLWVYWIIPPTICLIAVAIAFLLLAISFEEKRYRAIYASEMLRAYW